MFFSMIRGARFGLALLGSATFSASMTLAGSAQMGSHMKDQIVDDIGTKLVAQIQSESCADFTAMMSKSKSGGSSHKAGAMLKSNPAERARFVDKVAGPLVNKMIDCDLLPRK